MSMHGGWQMMRAMSRDDSVREVRLAEGTTRRVLSYAKPHSRTIGVFLVLVVLDAMLVVTIPLLLKRLIDDGVIPGDSALVVRIALVVALIAVLEAVLTMAQRWFSSQIGEGLIYALRTEVFGHVLRQPIAFFTRAQTGALVSRLNSDVIGAQQAFTTVLSSVVSNAVSLVLIIAAMLTLSWQLTLGALTLVASLATAMVYGFGGVMAVDGGLQVGTLVALAALLARLYGPLTSLSNVRVDIMTALVSFERVFEVLDLQPLVAEAADAVDIPAGPVRVEVEGVSFRYPGADEVSLASLESAAHGDRKGSGPVLDDVTFCVEPGQTVALVGPSGAGKTTITSLVARLYDPTTGSVRLNGVPLTHATDASLRSVVGMVTQEAHLFHDTIRGNLLYARPDASEDDMWSAIEQAQIRDLVAALPEGLDTVVGDRGHRLSGGEKQRIALARLLLKAPGLIILDEATAHLDSESEAAVQRALDEALARRTALVIAHRLSTVRSADLILVVEDGRIVERGTHAALLGRSGLYADLYRTQFVQ